jgi:hypothetical protein
MGPYYAMFPTAFAKAVIERYTNPGDSLIDPFLGRGTSTFSAAASGRVGIGIELNPVGWVYAKTKLAPANKSDVMDRFIQLARVSSAQRHKRVQLPEFFRYCFSDKVLEFLLAARNLDWRSSAIDRTAMALLLVNLHGKREASLSNQMMQTKAMAPDYAVRWWRAKKLKPPDLDPVEFLSQKLAWRYAKGVLPRSESRVYLGDSIRVLPQITGPLQKEGIAPAKLLFTSPPYYGVTNYHYDQWLRLWLLGGLSRPAPLAGSYRGKFENRQRYEALLCGVFSRAKELLHRNSIVYVRTDRRDFTLQTTIKVLSDVFPKKRIRKILRPFDGPTQTQLFGDYSQKVGEVDIILS